VSAGVGVEIWGVGGGGHHGVEFYDLFAIIVSQSLSPLS
jgi:hypothetical protein